MRRISLFVFILSLVSLTACLIKPPPPIPEPWNEVEDFLSFTNIEQLYATPTELYILSDEEFARIDLDHTLIEKRRLGLPSRFYGRPAMSEHTFYQLIKNGSVDSIQLNFYLTKNPEPIYKINVDDFLEPGFSEFKGVDSNGANSTGTYSDDGTKFIVPVILSPEDYYVFLVFDINLNLSNDGFESIDFKARIDVPELPADANNLNNVEYIDGFFYATSQDGAIRIDPVNGTYDKIFDDWMLDIFKYDNKIYAAGFGNLLFVSETNGLSYIPVDLGEEPYPIESVEIINGQIISQRAIGFPFSLIDPELKTGAKLAMNTDFELDFTSNQDMTFFNNNFYFPLFKKLYYAPELITEE